MKNGVVNIFAGAMMTVGCISGMAHASQSSDRALIYDVEVLSKGAEFRYAELTATHPLKIVAQTIDGRCRFDLSFVGLQQGATPDMSLTGRIEGGNCGGKGLAIASVVPSGSQDGFVRLNSQIMVFVQVGPTTQDAGESYASEAGAAFQFALKAMAPDIARVANDMAVAYQARCGKPVTVDLLRKQMEASVGFMKALAILNLPDPESGAHRAEYFDLVTSVQCAS